MKLEFSVLQDKIRGCWAGKNAGGVLGAPFEGRRGRPEIQFYTQDLSAGPPPNDDLDLQLVWLAAVERYGRQVNASILGEYWLSYVIPNWVEYGMGKANLRAGLRPPLSGSVDNVYKNSCGCFIRSEIWACLAPGHPEIAVRYAYEDAIVDHADEGMYGELFFAALQSAAFVEDDRDTLLDIALSYIPDDCAVSRCVREAQTCWQSGQPLEEARRRIHAKAPGTFGIQGVRLSQLSEEARELPLGQAGFDAPENIGFTIAGWYYGDDDFGKSLCLAVSCGEDTDCTAATLGALIGIIRGASALPSEWMDPLGDQIATMCVDRTSGGIWIPDTVSQLTDRVLRVIPGFLGVDVCDLFAPGGYTLDVLSGEALKAPPADDYLPEINGNSIDHDLSISALGQLSPDTIRCDYPAFTMLIRCHDGPFIRPGEPRSLTVTVMNNGRMHQQHWVRIRLHLPAGLELDGPDQVQLPLNYNFQSNAAVTFRLTDIGQQGQAVFDLLVEAELVGRHSSAVEKIRLMRHA